jgi:transposase
MVQDELPLGKVKAGGRGRPARANREILNAIFWILCSGSPWRGLPERYRPWQTVYDRFNKWQKLGIFERVLVKLQIRLQQDGFIDLDTWFMDSTVNRAHKAAAGAKKKNK